MSYRTFAVGHGRDMGYFVVLEERSRFFDFILNVADKIDAMTGHRLCMYTSFVGAPLDWAEKRNKILGYVTITREEADKYAWPMKDGSSPWAFMDDDEEDELEVTEIGA